MQIMKKILFFILSILFSSAAFSSFAGDEAFYFDLSNPSRQFIIGERGASFGKMLFPTNICPASSEYICFGGAGVFFSIPRQAKQLDKWQHADVDYAVVARQRMFFLSDEVDAIFIQGTEAHGANFRYTYSYDRGLMSFEISTPGESGRLFLLEGRCGFGASAKCTLIEK